MYKINFSDKQISKIIAHHRPSLNSSGFNHLPELNQLYLEDGSYLGTIENDERIYDVYIVLNYGSMSAIHAYSKYGLRFEARENEADRLEKIQTAKWLLSKNVISKQQALEEYGYSGE